MQIEIPYTPQPRQIIFHQCPADEVLYGGAAGGGKTESLLFEALISCLEVTGYKALYLRRTFPDLERSVIRRSQTKFPKGLGKYHEVKHLWTFVNKSTLEFGSLDKEMDVLKYQSAEYDLIIFDELTHFTEFQYTYLKSRNRTVLPGVKPRMRAGTNPGGIGHAWVKTYFIEPSPPESIFQTKEGTSRCFIPAKVTDNLILIERDPGYIKRLDSLPENERRALRDGDWDVFAGQYFKEFRRDLHSVDPFPIPSHWNRFASLDWGYAAPCGILWHTVEPSSSRVITYRELYISETLATDVAKKFKDLSKGETIHYVKASPDMWQERGLASKAEQGESIAEMFLNEDIYIEPADNRRVMGWNRVREYLQVSPDGKPWWVCFNTCVNLIRTLPELIHDQRLVEDVDGKCEDHLPEALRYGLMSRPTPEGFGGGVLLAGDFPGTGTKLKKHSNFDLDEDEDRETEGVGFY